MNMVYRFWAAALAVAVALGPLAAAQAQESRSVGRIFFENDQRRILEGIRQGIIDTAVASGPIDFEPIEIPTPEFVPIELPLTDELTGEVVRPQDIRVGGYLRNHRTGGLRFTVGSSVITERDTEYLSSLGLKVVSDADGRIRVFDALTEQSHPIARGSIIRRRGGVDESASAGDRFIIVKR